MPSARVVRESPIRRTPRVQQLEGIFDIPLEKKSRLEWTAELPLDERTWQIGLIVGPSGCGKSTIAGELFGKCLQDSAAAASEQAWPADAALVDGFPEAMGAKEIVELLCSVGFSSPPSWLRPYHVLSTGEKFRVSMARLLAEGLELAVVDEFTSVVDRRVAQIGSAALAKAIRRRPQQKFIAVTCHEDVEAWLDPDWIFRPATASFAWRSLRRRPALQLDIALVHHTAWKLFRQHHYLSTELNRTAWCFAAFLDGNPVAFSSWINLVGRRSKGPQNRGRKREHRTVTLPDFQGVGIGNMLSAYCASLWKALGYRAFSTTSHPAMIRARQASSLWNMHRAPSFASRGDEGEKTSSIGISNRRAMKRAGDRLTAGFEYVGPPLDRATAELITSVRPAAV